jgi:hypothetical protein
MPGPAAERQRDLVLERTIMVLLGVGLLAFYLAIQRGEWVSWDGRKMGGVARNLWEHGRLQLFRDSFGG